MKTPTLEELRALRAQEAEYEPTSDRPDQLEKTYTPHERALLRGKNPRARRVLAIVKDVFGGDAELQR